MGRHVLTRRPAEGGGTCRTVAGDQSTARSAGAAEEIPGGQGPAHLLRRFPPLRVDGERGFSSRRLAVTGIAFHAILGLLGIRGQVDLRRPIWIINLDYEGFQPFAVTFARVKAGCAVCDEARVADLRIDYAE